MTKEQAFQILVQAAEQSLLSKQGHEMVQHAINILKSILDSANPAPVEQ